MKSLLIKAPIMLMFLVLSAVWYPSHLNAQIDQFVYSVAGGQTFTWTEPASPTPTVVNPTNFFIIPGTASDPAGVGGTLTFFSSAQSGGFSARTSSNVLSVIFFSSQLYSGTEEFPTFLLGTFIGTDRRNPATLTISELPVPEPETYVMLATFMSLLFAVKYFHQRPISRRSTE